MIKKWIATITVLLFALVSTSSWAADPAAFAKGRSLALAQCASCHGEIGISTMPQFPKLAGQHASYIKKALSDYQSGARKNPIMGGVAKGLSKEDISVLALYFSSQKGLHAE